MRFLFFVLLQCWLVQGHAITEIRFSAETISSDGMTLQNPRAVVDLDRKQAMTVHADSMQLGDATLQQPLIEVEVGKLPIMRITTAMMQVDQFEARNPRIVLDYRLQPAQPTLAFDADVKAKHDATWGRFHLNCLIPADAGQQTWRCQDGVYQDVRSNTPFQIEVTPTIKAMGERTQRGAEMLLRVAQARFADDTGLHAGEKLTGEIRLSAYEQANGWRWSGVFDWSQGELFWQPFYFAKGRKHFEIEGYYKAPTLDILRATLQLEDVGTLHTSSRINLVSKDFVFLKVDATDVDFHGVYSAFIQPLVAQSAFGNLDVTGKADWTFEAKGLQPLKFNLKIMDASVEDQQGKFGFTRFNAEIPWDYDHPQTIRMGYSAGHILKIPLGETHWQAEVNRFSITAPELQLPVLDGALKFQNVSAAWINQNMVWHVSMDMQPISMSSFSQALNWPEMRGQIDGDVPLVTYANHTLRMDGAMVFTLFNGKIGMSGLEIDDPLGLAPKLHANLNMRDIDLGEITRTFNFGSITGKLEGDVQDLRLQNWKPVYMNAVIQTADGPFEKKVSQRAVENITALGGEGTAAALQRTFLRFFKSFGYEKIGLRCELRGDICKMGGVETTPTGFVIVKGKGAPTVNVNGYTQYVSWKDMLARMQRITDSNTKMIIK